MESDGQQKSLGENKSFTLRPLENADVATCAHIAGEAFKKDRHTQLKTRCPENPYDHEEGMKGAFAHWLSRPSGTIEGTVAVDQTSGQVVGWIVWGFRGFDDDASRQGKVEENPEEKVEEKTKDEVKDKVEVEKEQIEPDTAPPTESTPPVKKRTRASLEEYTSADLQTWMKRLMPPGTKCMFICSIAVHPSYEGHGIGTQLMAQGTTKADAEGVKCWVHASEAGAQIFETCGFEQVGSLALDLDAWNVDNIVPPEGDGAKWGIYTFRYMVRPARKRESMLVS
ncbi:Hypothetical protein R9X50_00535400 [Acrodontium crateriforme]|uniref:N-acetyltransferase domain-containing protein n=1 Tax=Acrodontium crateriforme TaxID=150365 RepID=A0AAQ3R922_9PEZI|nr:Hypothetical protein R9X50_00535400 [Acrodontium crateriforme]